MCRDCVNRTEYDGLNRARCILHNTEVYKGSGSCVFEETDPTKRATEVLVPTAKNKYEYKTPFKGMCIVETMCVGGHWYKGVMFDTMGIGTYSHPSIFGTPYETERDAINAVFDHLIRFCRDYPEVVAFAKQCRFENKQLTLF